MSGVHANLLLIARRQGICANSEMAEAGHPRLSRPSVPDARPSEPRITEPPRSVVGPAAFVGLLALLGVGLFGYMLIQRLDGRAAARETLHSTPSILMSVRDVARLETTELHVEKVIDLADNQSRLFGLIDATDAILLVAAGDVTIGIDLGKVKDEDLAIDPGSGTAKLTLPEPEILSTRLDEQHTYVYKRTTGLLAHRNEGLESHARQEAVKAIEAAVRDMDVMQRAKRQAERQLGALLQGLGAKGARIEWRTSS